jgi:hypothetical protein
MAAALGRHAFQPAALSEPVEIIPRRHRRMLSTRSRFARRLN